MMPGLKLLIRAPRSPHEHRRRLDPERVGALGNDVGRAGSVDLGELGQLVQLLDGAVGQGVLELRCEGTHVAGLAGDDDPRAARTDDPSEGLQQVDGPQKVDGDDPLRRRLVRGHPGGVDETRHRAERRSVLGEGVDRRLVGDIHGPGVDLIALTAQLLCDGGELGLVVVGEQQATTGGATPPDGDADAAGADQNGDLPGHLRRGGRPCSRGGRKIRVSGCGHPSTVAAAAAPEKTGSFQGTAVPPRPGPGSMAPCASVGSTMMRDMPPRTTSRQSALSTFLRTRRDRLSPAEVGLSPGVGLRRTPGLRREELAALAGISVDYYIRLERGSESRPSAAVVDALARALKLDEHERRHLHDLAAHSQGNRDDLVLLCSSNFGDCLEFSGGVRDAGVVDVAVDVVVDTCRARRSLRGAGGWSAAISGRRSRSWTLV